MWRKHEDDFVLDRSRPNWYRNQHTTDLYGVELQASVTSRWGTTTVAGEMSREDITSSNLGDHSRNKGGFLVEHSAKVSERVVVLPGAAVYWHEGYGWQVWPGLDLGYRTNEWSRLFVTVGRSYRVPNYTDLYYVSPANMGNPDLLPEKAWTYEAGGAIDRDLWSARASVFIREGRDLIDWARQSTDVPWQVLNVSSVTTSGLELSFRLTPEMTSGVVSADQISTAYTYLDSDRSTGPYESKYLLDHLSHQANFGLDLTWLEVLNNNWRLRYQRRIESTEAWVVDARLAIDLNNLNVFVEASNLFDEVYSEIGTVPMPGRWVWMGMSYDLALR
jgi:iron complex outermembrane receptor protein